MILSIVLSSFSGPKRSHKRKRKCPEERNFNYPQHVNSAATERKQQNTQEGEFNMPQPYNVNKCMYEAIPTQNVQQNGSGETEKQVCDEIDLQEFSNLISAIPRNYPYQYSYTPQIQYPRQQGMRPIMDGLQQAENQNEFMHSANAYNGQHYGYYNNHM